jgi:hypothetical protein
LALNSTPLRDDIYFGFCVAISAGLALGLEDLGCDLFLRLDYLLYCVGFLRNKAVLFVF